MVRKKAKQRILDSEFLFWKRKKGGGNAVGQWSCTLSLILYCFNKMIIASGQAESIGRMAKQEVEVGP